MIDRIKQEVWDALKESDLPRDAVLQINELIKSVAEENPDAVSELMPKDEFEIQFYNDIFLDCKDENEVEYVSIYQDCAFLSYENNTLTVSNKDLDRIHKASLEHRRGKDFESRYSLHDVGSSEWMLRENHSGSSWFICSFEKEKWAEKTLSALQLQELMDTEIS